MGRCAAAALRSPCAAGAQLFQISQIVQRLDAGGILVPFGPHDRRAIAGQRQDRKGARRQETFMGHTFMRVFMGHGADQAGLAIAPFGDRDPGLVAQP